MSSFASAPSRGYAATPIETVARIGWLEVSTSNAFAATARRIRSAISSASSALVSGRGGPRAGGWAPTGPGGNRKGGGNKKGNPPGFRFQNRGEHTPGGGDQG